jgi:RNA polymerase sigma-70 factor (ECF subfamily)
MADDPWSTSSTLLGRLRNPADGKAWEEFVARYCPHVVDWCRRGGLQHADVEDTTQKILLKMVVRMRSFHYDHKGSFRGWLHTVTRNVIIDLRHELQRPGSQGSGRSEVQSWLESTEAHQSLLQHLDEEFDRELLELALDGASVRVEPKTWKTFAMLKIQGRPGAEVARELGIPVANVFVYANRVVKLVQEEIAKLDRGAHPENGDLP